MVILAILLAGAWAAAEADLSPAYLVAHPGGLVLAGRFLSEAFTPDLSSETLALTLEATWTTVLFAAAAMTLSLVGGVVLGFLASPSWWARDPPGGESLLGRLARRSVFPALYAVTPDRSGIAGAVDGFANLFEAHSFTGRGVMQSWAVGQALGELIATGRYGALDLSALARTRFADRSRWVEEELHI